MPPRAAKGTIPDWDGLFEDAEAQAGHFTAKQAAAHHIGKRLLTHHTKTGHLERAGRGLFRFRRFPRGPLDEYVVVWLWSGQQGVFSHETALLLHELSDTLPSRLHLTVPAAWATRRLKVPPLVTLHYRDVPPDERDWKGPVPLTAVAPTIRDCIRDSVQPELWSAAARQARQRGLITVAEARRAFGNATEVPRALVGEDGP